VQKVSQNGKRLRAMWQHTCLLVIDHESVAHLWPWQAFQTRKCTFIGVD